MKTTNIQRWIAILFLVLLVNTAYISAFSTATVFYMTNVLLHLVLGVALGAAFLWTWRRWDALKSGAPTAMGFFLLALLSGAILATLGNVRANAWILWAHIVVGAGGVAALIPFVWKKAASDG